MSEKESISKQSTPIKHKEIADGYSYIHNEYGNDLEDITSIYYNNEPYLSLYYIADESAIIGSIVGYLRGRVNQRDDAYKAGYDAKAKEIRRVIGL